MKILDPCLSVVPGVQESFPGSRASLNVSKCCVHCDYQNCLLQMGYFLCKSTIMVFSAANNTGHFPAWLLGWTCCTKLSLFSQDAFLSGVMPARWSTNLTPRRTSARLQKQRCFLPLNLLAIRRCPLFFLILHHFLLVLVGNCEKNSCKQV